MAATPTWQCRACGKTMQRGSRPGNTDGGKCTETASGNHMWEKVQD